MQETQPLIERLHAGYCSTSNADGSDESTLATPKQSTKHTQQDIVKKLHTGWRRYSTSIYLENTGSVARDHLANERTYLAWLRTSLSVISVGVAITQLLRLDDKLEPELRTSGRPAGLVFIMMGMLLLIFALIRYFHTQTAIIEGYFPASRGIIIMTSTIALAVLVALFIVIIR